MVTLTYQDRFKTLSGVFDEFTNRTLFQLQSKKIFDEIESPLSIGKESNVFIGDKDGTKVIVKIYRVQNCDFKRMFEYIGQDPRYAFLRKKRREIVFSWVQREYKNLIKANRGKVQVPKIIGWKNHIIVEEMIGNPSPPLKDQYPNDPNQFLKDIIQEMKKLYDCGLIHGDLSSFNILNHEEKPVLIDFSQATLTRTPNSTELLIRDIKNIALFFRKMKIEVNEEETLKKVTGK